MTPHERIEEIRERYEQRAWEAYNERTWPDAIVMVEDIDWLLSELERTQRENERYRKALQRVCDVGDKAAVDIAAAALTHESEER